MGLISGSSQPGRRLSKVAICCLMERVCCSASLFQKEAESTSSLCNQYKKTPKIKIPNQAAIPTSSLFSNFLKKLFQIDEQAKLYPSHLQILVPQIPFQHVYISNLTWKILQDSLRNYSFHSSASPSALKKETLLQRTGLEDCVREFSWLKGL